MRRSNRNQPWRAFDAAAYVDQNEFVFPDDEDEHTPLNVDLWLFAQLIAGLRQIAERKGPLDIVSLATGPNLAELLAELMFAWRLRVIELAPQNREYIRARQRVGLGRHEDLDAGWLGWVRYAAELGVEIDLERFNRIEIADGDMFNLPSEMADVIVVLQGYESATGLDAEFDQGADSAIRALRPEGSLFAAFMDNPAGVYEVAGERFDAVHVTKPRLEGLFGPWFREVEVLPVPGASEIRDAGCGMWYMRALGRL